MIEGLFISASGMLPKAMQQEAIANNLANSEVPGFKKDNLFMREMREAMKRQSGDYPEWRINRFEGAWTDHDQAELRRTGDVFDMAITGKGFFALQTPNGMRHFGAPLHRCWTLPRLFWTPLIVLNFPVLERPDAVFRRPLAPLGRP